MKPMYIAAAMALFLGACGQKETEENGTTADTVKTQNQQQGTPGTSTLKPAMQDGPYAEMYPGTQQVKIEGEVQNGTRFGLWKSYYPTGNKQSEGYYEDGKKNGKTATYYKNGRIRYLGYYHWDKPIGKWEFYDEEGKLVTVKDYK